MATSVFTGWRTVTPGACVACGYSDGWDCDGGGTITCDCQTPPEEDNAPAIDEEYVQTFVTAYLGTALWSGTDDEGAPLDDTYSSDDFAEDAERAAVKDCRDFIESNAALLLSVGDADQNGHDFSLTRNGHGAGFWDRGYGPAGDALSKACKPYGSADIYVGDDGKLHFS